MAPSTQEEQTLWDKCIKIKENVNAIKTMEIYYIKIHAFNQKIKIPPQHSFTSDRLKHSQD